MTNMDTTGRQMVLVELAVGEFLIVGAAAVKLLGARSGGQVKLGILAPREVPVARAEARHPEEHAPLPLPEIGGEAGGA